jgi:Mrp family chromosome partitioning ATPase
VTPADRPTSSSFASHTGELVRGLLARSDRMVPHSNSGGVSQESHELISVHRSPAISSNVSAFRITGPEEEADQFALPMPALTREEMAERARRPIPHPIPKDARDPEIYRLIYGGLKLPRNAPVVVIGITSAIRGEGRTTITRLMAQTLSKELDTRVTLVEADIENPTLSRESSKAGAHAGLASLLRQECQLHEVIGRWSNEYPNLYVIPAGQATDDAPRLLRLLSTRDPFRGLDGLQGLVILDLPPLADGSYGAAAAEVADATVLVVRAGVTHSDTVREAVARMGDRPPQGVILNGFRSPIPGWVPRFR